MPQIKDLLQSLFGDVRFERQTDIEAIRTFYYEFEDQEDIYCKHAYCLDEQGNIIGLASLSNSAEEISLPPEFQHLRYLNLGDNPQLRRLQLCEEGMPDLEHLDLSDSGLDMLSIPKGFTALKHLDVSRNQLQKFETEDSLSNLEFLDLSGNQLTSLELDAPALQDAYLLDNQLTELTFEPAPEKLEVLNLRKNKLETLSNKLLEWTSLKLLYLHSNPLTDLPSEIHPDKESDNSLEKIRDYLQEFKKGTIRNDRVKLIIVGNGRVGKTSICKRLAEEPFDSKEQYTHGVQLGKLRKQHLPEVETETLQLQVWDFGGQEIFHATHQFFLSDEAIYLLAWTDEQNVIPYRERDKEGLPYDRRWRTCEYWLENIRLNSADSPIVIVQTHSDVLEHKKSNDPEWTKAPYGAVALDFSAAKDFGLPELRAILTNKLNTTIPMLGKEFPETYDKVIQLIEQRKKEVPYISHTDFLDLCEQAGIDKGGEDSLMDYLVKAGVVVYFKKELLKEIVYINPNWLTEQVYKLIDNELEPRGGQIDQHYLERILPAPEYDDLKRKQFLELLKSFELIFQPEGKAYFIAPQYLPEKLEPMAQQFYNSIFKKLTLGFIFRFPRFLPDNVMINFLSRYGPYSSEVYWKNGIFFTNDQGEECIVHFKESTKSLWVYGQENQATYALQREVCQAFIELSKNANAEISLDGEHFVSWQELEHYFEPLAQHPDADQMIMDVDKKKMLHVRDFMRFSEKGEYRFEKSFEITKTNKNMSVQSIRKLLAEGRLREGVEALAEVIPTHLKNNIVLLQGKLAALERNIRLGVIAGSEANLERNRITYAALEYCKEVGETIEEDDLHVGGEQVSKILFLAANPHDSSRLQVDQEHRILKEQLRQGGQRDRFEFLPPQYAVTVSELLRAMNDKPNIVHFSGHGQMEGIAIATDNNQTQLLPIPALKRLFKTLKGVTEIVVLNACYSANQAKMISEFGMYVIGNNLPITDKGAISFSKGFYNGLGEGKNLEEAFNDAMIVVLAENPNAADVIEVWKDGKKLDL